MIIVEDLMGLKNEKKLVFSIGKYVFDFLIDKIPGIDIFKIVHKIDSAVNEYMRAEEEKLNIRINLLIGDLISEKITWLYDQYNPERYPDYMYPDSLEKDISGFSKRVMDEVTNLSDLEVIEKLKERNIDYSNYD